MQNKFENGLSRAYRLGAIRNGRSEGRPAKGEIDGSSVNGLALVVL